MPAHHCMSHPCPLCYPNWPQPSWPWQVRQAGTFTMGNTGPTVEERLARLEQIVAQLCPDKSHDI